MKIRPVTTLTSIIFTIFAAAACQQKDASALMEDHGHHHADAPSVHGMLVFGSEKIWLSHLPMFHKPHDYQVIMEVNLKKNGQDLKPVYLDDQAQSGAAYYTFVPKKFSMTHLIAGHLASVEGILVRGHFERGGIPIVSGVTAEIVSMPVAAQFQPGAVKPVTAGYYVLGSDKETFLAHKIVTKPDEFDQVIKVTVSGTSSPANAVSVGDLLITQLPNVPDQRLQEGMTADAVDKEGDSVTITVEAEVYIETGDLEL